MHFNYCSDRTEVHVWIVRWVEDKILSLHIRSFRFVHSNGKAAFRPGVGAVQIRMGGHSEWLKFNSFPKLIPCLLSHDPAAYTSCHFLKSKPSIMPSGSIYGYFPGKAHM